MPPKKKAGTTKKAKSDASEALIDGPDSIIAESNDQLTTNGGGNTKRKTRKQKKEEQEEEQQQVEVTEKENATEENTGGLYPVLPEDTPEQEEDISKKPPAPAKKGGKKAKPWDKKREQEEQQKVEEEEDSKPKPNANQKQQKKSKKSQEPVPPTDDPEKTPTKQTTDNSKSQPPASATAAQSDTPLVPLNKQNRKRPASMTNMGNSPKRRDVAKTEPQQPTGKPQQATKPPLSDNNNYKELDQRFNKLKNLRETQVEKSFREYREAAEKRDRANEMMLKDLNERMNQEIERIAQQYSDPQETENLQDQLESAQSQLEDAKNEIRLLQAKLGQSANNKDNTSNSLSLCSDLSGLTIQNVESTEEGLIFDCIQSGRYGVLHYTLSEPNQDDDESSSDEITYNPLSDNSETVLAQLPDYFLEPLSFSRDAGAQFYWKVSQALNKK